MGSNSADATPADHVAPVGPFTGFGNFLGKEFRDWWNSWRLIIIFAVMTLILTLMVFFVFTRMKEAEQRFVPPGSPPPSEELIGTRLLVGMLSPNGPGLILHIFIIIFSTMGLLTLEKSSGTLAWNLTKPLGRTGLFVAKWLAATLVLWLAMCVAPILVASLCMKAYHGITPHYDKMAPVVAGALAWVGLWVLLSLTTSLFFQSQGAVAGVLIAFWVVPNLLGVLMGEVLGEEAMKWVVDRLATNAPFWAWDMFADRDLTFRRRPPEWKNLYVYAFAVWTLFLSVLSLRIFQRQEVGS